MQMLRSCTELQPCVAPCRAISRAHVSRDCYPAGCHSSRLCLPGLNALLSAPVSALFAQPGSAPVPGQTGQPSTAPAQPSTASSQPLAGPAAPQATPLLRPSMLGRVMIHNRPFTPPRTRGASHRRRQPPSTAAPAPGAASPSASAPPQEPQPVQLQAAASPPAGSRLSGGSQHSEPAVCLEPEGSARPQPEPTEQAGSSASHADEGTETGTQGAEEPARRAPWRVGVSVGLALAGWAVRSLFG